MENERKKGLFQKITNGRKMGKDQFVICILVGILLIIIAVPTSETSGEKSKESVLSDSKSNKIEESSKTDNIPAYIEEKNEYVEEYERCLENRLEQAISAMEGAGKVKVMVRVSTSRELVVEKDIPTVSSNTTENDSEGGSRNVSEMERTEETVYIRESDGSSSPYVVKTLQPLIEGVVVVAQGGNKPEVSKNITEAIVALFDIEPHKIKVVKMKSE